MSDWRSRIWNTEATAADPLARSEVMLPASAMTFPVLTRMKKVLKTSPADICPDSTSFPPNQKSKAHDMKVRHCAEPIPIPASHDFFLASFLGSSCASSNSFSTWPVKKLDLLGVKIVPQSPDFKFFICQTW